VILGAVILEALRWSPSPGGYGSSPELIIRADTNEPPSAMQRFRAAKRNARGGRRRCLLIEDESCSRGTLRGIRRDPHIYPLPTGLVRIAPAEARRRAAMSDRKPLMPKATAVWLVENTSLSFDQIAEFCGLHVLEVKGIADGDVAQGIKGLDPVTSN